MINLEEHYENMLVLNRIIIALLYRSTLAVSYLRKTLKVSHLIAGVLHLIENSPTQIL